MIKSVQSKKKHYSYSYRRILIFCRELSQSSDNNSVSSSPKPVAVVSSEHSINVRVNSDALTTDDLPSKPQVKFDLDNDEINNNMFSIFSPMYSGAHRMY
jgi:hypothetical protein